jgi:uncharacterized protein YlxW (UPF0749 family)
MKVNTYSNITQIFNRVTDKTSDKQGGAGSNAFDQQKQKKKEEENEFEASIEAVEAAVEHFGADETNRSSGLSASTEGSGPGLKVLLKDSTGGILRSISGEEFLKLKEAVNSGARSGRLLDQKA